MGRFILPEPTLRAIRDAPEDRATVLLLRHSARGPLPDGAPGNDVPLLPEGTALARELGRWVGRRLRTIHTSPVRRCVETAEFLVQGAESATVILEDRHLGHPGVYVQEGPEAWHTWQSLGHERVMAHLVAGDHLPGLNNPVLATRRLMAHLRETAGARPGVHVFVTHDSLVATAAAHVLRVPLGKADWPWYLEALVIVEDGDNATAAYRGWAGKVPCASSLADTSPIRYTSV